MLKHFTKQKLKRSQNSMEGQKPNVLKDIA